MHVIAVELSIKPAKRDAYIKEVKRHAPVTRKDEPGCLLFDVAVDQADPNAIVLYEVYNSDEALELHRKSPSLKLYMEATGDMVEKRNPHFAVQRVVRQAKTTPPLAPRMPVLFITLKIDPARLSDYLRLIEQQVADVMTQEEGCLHFEVSVDKSEPATVYLYEVWQSEAAFGTHRGGPVQARFFAASEGMVMDRRRRTAFKLL
jgi:quinol monooxygenase YgiN